MFWAIPMGKLNHRDEKQKDRLNKYINYPDRDIRSCYYHIGKTTTKSIFFISNAFPVTDKYISEEHLGKDNSHYIIKNKTLIAELERKLIRILSDEDIHPNRYQQHITDLKNNILKELKLEKELKEKSALNNTFAEKEEFLTDIGEIIIGEEYDKDKLKAECDEIMNSNEKFEYIEKENIEKDDIEL